MTTERKSYSSNKFQLELPYLIEVQKASYEQFLQKEIPQEKRLKVGLERVFQDIFPITDVKGLYSLNYEGYYFGIPKYSIPECRERGLTYSMELYATLSLQIFEEDGEDRKLKEEVKNDVRLKTVRSSSMALNALSFPSCTVPTVLALTKNSSRAAVPTIRAVLFRIAALGLNSIPKATPFTSSSTARRSSLLRPCSAASVSKRLRKS